MNKDLRDIFQEIEAELGRAREKYPDDNPVLPWYGYDWYQQCGIVICEAGEALQATNKFKFNCEGSEEDIKHELIQTASTAIRMLLKMREAQNVRQDNC